MAGRTLCCMIGNFAQLGLSLSDLVVRWSSEGLLVHIVTVAAQKRSPPLERKWFDMFGLVEVHRRWVEEGSADPDTMGQTTNAPRATVPAQNKKRPRPPNAARRLLRSSPFLLMTPAWWIADLRLCLPAGHLPTCCVQLSRVMPQ